MTCAMEPRLVETLILQAAFLPWGVEVVLQLRLQTRLLRALPEATRAALPPHPEHPKLAFLGSARFHLALWRFVRRDLPDDDGRVVVLKRKIRATLRREAVWILGAFTALGAMLARGWRPPYWW
jgi:hypothetical protein